MSGITNGRSKSWQMALAGLRLARLLNETLGKMTPRDFE
jgi:hypothetical protein